MAVSARPWTVADVSADRSVRPGAVRHPAGRAAEAARRRCAGRVRDARASARATSIHQKGNIDMENKQTLFAFKLASKDNGQPQAEAQWKAQDGVSAAGCTDYRFPGNVRYPHSLYGADRGVYC
jgi:hypothetical protein